MDPDLSGPAPTPRGSYGTIIVGNIRKVPNNLDIVVWEDHDTEGKDEHCRTCRMRTARLDWIDVIKHVEQEHPDVYIFWIMTGRVQ